MPSRAPRHSGADRPYLAVRSRSRDNSPNQRQIQPPPLTIPQHLFRCSFIPFYSDPPSEKENANQCWFPGPQSLVGPSVAP